MDQQGWEQHYLDKEQEDLQPPDTLLTDNRTLLTGGTALDIAMGSGRNALFLAECGYAVTCIDRAESAVKLAEQTAKKRGLNLNAVQADMLDVDLGIEQFDLIANFYFLERDLIPRIKQALKPDGLVFFETFTSWGISRDDPRYRKFLIDPNELLTMFSDFFIMFYHERVRIEKAVASMIAKKV
jgi:2-polyprenyl-3-methyl-5-hydroxy-6-metoxy-1,4-benzoquinol methylase